jgi:hypothetical protein
MAPKKATVAELTQELSEKDAELLAARNENAALKAQLAQASVDHAAALKAITDKFSSFDLQFAEVTKKLAALEGREPAARTPADSPYLAAARQAIPATGQPRRQQQRAVEPEDTARFVVYAPPDKSPDEVLSVVVDNMGLNRDAIRHVHKIPPRASSQPNPATNAVASSSDPAVPPPRVANAVFVFTTSTYVADKAVKGGDLRKQLRELQQNIYIDDYLTKEEKEERKRRAGEKQQLKDAGVTAAWRRAALWMLEKVDGNKDVWKIVDAQQTPAAAPAPSDT